MSMPGSLDEIVALRERLLPQVCQPIQFPEPSLKLNLESRADSQERMFKHVHQSCLLHRENFCVGSQIKHLYLLDAYIGMARQENSLGVYMAARSMLEFNAFLHHVSVQLQEATAAAAGSWLDGGRQFFAIIVRARFATSRSDYKALLETAGLDKVNSMPWRIGTCIQSLERETDFKDAGARYGTLCDYVHHNLGSATTANAGSAEADAALASGGGMLLMSKPGTVTQYQYPVPFKATIGIGITAAGFLQDANGCVRWLNEMPGSPYSSEVVQTFTGNSLGFANVRAGGRRTPSNLPKVSRNDPCPCGSGRKFKKCCLQ